MLQKIRAVSYLAYANHRFTGAKLKYVGPHLCIIKKKSSFPIKVNMAYLIVLNSRTRFISFVFCWKMSPYPQTDS